MRLSMPLRSLLAAAFAVGCQVAAAQAQSNLTFVATTGLDNNSCASAATACRTLQRAHNQTTPGGRVMILDSGWFGTVAINRSISIVAHKPDNDLGSLSAASVYVQGDTGDQVYLDGLYLRSWGSSTGGGPTSGLHFGSGQSVHLRNCVIEGFAGAGVLVEAIDPNSRVTISDCVIRGNYDGVYARTVGKGSVLVVLDDVTIEQSGRDGVRAQGVRTEVRVNNARVINNPRALRALNNSQIVSSGNNLLAGNGSNGAFTAMMPLE